MHNYTDFVAKELKGQPLHPVQLYEAASLFALAGLLTWLILKRKTRDGTVAILYLTGYALIRFFMELFRGDDDRGTVLGGNLSTSQGIAILLFAVGLGLWGFRINVTRRVGRNL